MKVLRVLLLWLLGTSPVLAASATGTLSTPITTATVNVTTAGTTQIVAAQGTGIRIRVLGFFLGADREIWVRLQDAAGTPVNCTGTISIATGSNISVPVQPPGYICETTANTALNLNLINRAGQVGGVLIWQQSQ